MLDYYWQPIKFTVGSTPLPEDSKEEQSSFKPSDVRDEARSLNSRWFSSRT